MTMQIADVLARKGDEILEQKYGIVSIEDATPEQLEECWELAVIAVTGNASDEQD